MSLDTLFPGLDADTGDEQHAASPTAQLIDHLELFGFRPNPGEVDPRPLPDAGMAEAQLTAAFDAFVTLLENTRLEDDLAYLLWSLVNLFHRKLDRIERSLDDNEQRQRHSQADQDGSEIRSVELERLLDQGQALIERRNAFEAFRDYAAQLFEVTTGSAWRPRSGSVLNHRALTSAMIDSRDFIAARRRADSQLLMPAGTRIAFTGGLDCNDHGRIWAALDKPRRPCARVSACRFTAVYVLVDADLLAVPTLQRRPMRFVCSSTPVSTRRGPRPNRLEGYVRFAP